MTHVNTKTAITLGLTTGFLLLHAGFAHAHLGHVGDLAGHSHWIGIGALAAAGAIAFLVGKKLKKGDDSVEEAEEEATEIDAEAETSVN